MSGQDLSGNFAQTFTFKDKQRDERHLADQLQLMITVVRFSRLVGRRFGGRLGRLASFELMIATTNDR